MDLIKSLYQISKDQDILFVEDDDTLRSQMKAMFGELFRSVDVAENGRVGLEKYTDEREQTKRSYDLVITDINMPEMNGIEMIHEIYKINPIQPIVVVSAHGESEYLLALLKIGIDSFLIKPIEHGELITTLYKVVKAITNERLIEKHYKEIEALNVQLALKSEALKISNDEMRDKNIALEKSMRIIEGMHHKDQLHRKINLPRKALKTHTKENIEVPPSYLQNIEHIINNIALEHPYKKIQDESFKALSQAVNVYADSIPHEKSYESLSTALKQLSITFEDRPKCSSIQELERILSILESFFFIYSKWEKEWENIDIEKFETFSKSIENEIRMLIDVWHCKV